MNIADNFNIRQDLEQANVALDKMKSRQYHEDGHALAAEDAIHFLLAVVTEMRNEIAKLQRVVNHQTERLTSQSARIHELNLRTIGSMRLGSA